MKLAKTLALTLGVAAGAVATMVVAGRTGKRNSPYSSSLYNYGSGIKVTADMYDESEMRYI